MSAPKSAQEVRPPVKSAEDIRAERERTEREESLAKAREEFARLVPSTANDILKCTMKIVDGNDKVANEFRDAVRGGAEDMERLSVEYLVSAVWCRRPEINLYTHDEDGEEEYEKDILEWRGVVDETMKNFSAYKRHVPDKYAIHFRDVLARAVAEAATTCHDKPRMFMQSLDEAKKYVTLALHAFRWSARVLAEHESEEPAR